MRSSIRLTLFAIMILSLIGSMTSSCAEETVDLILSTRTTQAFEDTEIPEDDLNAILEAGLSATSAMNQQPWFFVAITNRDVMNEISGAAGSFSNPTGGSGEAPDGFDPSSLPTSDESVSPPEGASPPTGGGAKASLGDSPAAIIIYMDENTASTNPSFDCGLACQNMVIAARALGYGTKIVASPTVQLNGEDHDTLCEKLGVDTTCTAVAVLLIGSTESTVDSTTGASTRSELSEKVSFVD